MEGATTSSESTFEEKVQAEMEKVKDMKIGEMKMKLQARGVLTNHFCEKPEFVRAYAEIMVKDTESKSVDDEDEMNSALAALAGAEIGEDDVDEHDILEDLPLCVKHRVDKLKDLHEDREKILKDYLAERAKLETKYQDLFKPLYEKRADIVAGKLDEDIMRERIGVEEAGGEEQEETVKGIPQFWVCALGHMPVVAELLTERDIDCLEHLEDITCMDYENGEGFTLSFHFSANDFFENAILTKEYEVPNLLLADEPILKDVGGCEIRWKPGRSLTYKKVCKTQRGKGKNAGQVRRVMKKEKVESFFHFFTPPTMPRFEDMDEQEANRLEKAFDEDYDIAQAFRSHIIPKAALWFTGMAMEQEMAAALDGLQWPGSDGGSSSKSSGSKSSSSLSES